MRVPQSRRIRKKSFRTIGISKKSSVIFHISRSLGCLIFGPEGRQAPQGHEERARVRAQEGHGALREDGVLVRDEREGEDAGHRDCEQPYPPLLV